MENMETFRSAPVKLSDQALYEDNNLHNRIQLLRTGSFYHKGQQVEVKKADLEKMVQNFNEKVRGIDLMVDYSHDSEGEAAAWFEEVYLAEDGEQLWAKVLWTDGGKHAVLSKKYRYLSADFHFNYQDNETLAEYGPTLLGAGLTNRPVVKKMEPVIQLSENQKYEEIKMDELQKQIDEMKAEMASIKEMLKKEEEVELALPVKEEMPLEVKEKEEEMKLSEREEAVTLKEKELADTQKKMEIEIKFNKLFSEGKVCEAQRVPFMAGDMIKFSELSVALNTSTTGNHGNISNSVEDAELELIRIAELKAKAEKISFSESISLVLKENKELAEKYNNKFV